MYTHIRIRTYYTYTYTHTYTKQVIRVKKTRGAAAPRTRITWASFLSLEEPLLKLLRSAKLQSTNSSPISISRRSKSAIFFSSNINYSIHLLLRLSVGTRIIYIYIYIYIYISDERNIPEVEMKTI